MTHFIQSSDTNDLIFMLGIFDLTHEGRFLWRFSDRSDRLSDYSHEGFTDLSHSLKLNHAIQIQNKEKTV